MTARQQPPHPGQKVALSGENGLMPNPGSSDGRMRLTIRQRLWRSAFAFVVLFATVLRQSRSLAIGLLGGVAAGVVIFVLASLPGPPRSGPD
jgi:hypothetical protein